MKTNGARNIQRNFWENVKNHNGFCNTVSPFAQDLKGQFCNSIFDAFGILHRILSTDFIYIYLPTYLPACLPTCLPTYLPGYLSVCLSAYLSVCLYIYIFIYLYIYIYKYLYINKSVYLFICISEWYLSEYIYTYMCQKIEWTPVP